MKPWSLKIGTQSPSTWRDQPTAAQLVGRRVRRAPGSPDCPQQSRVCPGFKACVYLWVDRHSGPIPESCGCRDNGTIHCLLNAHTGAPPACLRAPPPRPRAVRGQISTWPGCPGPTLSPEGGTQGPFHVTPEVQRPWERSQGASLPRIQMDPGGLCLFHINTANVQPWRTCPFYQGLHCVSLHGWLREGG